MSAILLPYPPRVLSPNGRAHWAVKAKATKKARQVAFWLAKESRIRPEPGLIPMLWRFHPKTKGRVDIDNLVASCKAYADGIAQAWGVDDAIFRPTYELGEVMKDGMVCVEIL